MKRELLIISLVLTQISTFAQAFEWAKSFSGTEDQHGRSIAVDDLGNVYTAGPFVGVVDFDPGPGFFHLTSSGDNDIFFSKLDSLGNFVWAKSAGAEGNDRALTIAVDGIGNSYVTGYFQSNAGFQTDTGMYFINSVAGNWDVFIAKTDTSGNFEWIRNMGSDEDDYGYGIAVDDSGNVYTTGLYKGTVDFNPGPQTNNLTSLGMADMFILKLDGAGNFVWAKSLGGPGYDQNYSIDVDEDGNVFTAGFFQGTSDFNPGDDVAEITSVNSTYDVVVTKLDPAGNYLWAKSVGGEDNDYSYAVSTDDAGNVFLTGKFLLTVDFDPGAGVYELTSAGDDDIFILKLNPQGDFEWARSMGAANFDRGVGIQVDFTGNVLVTGYFQGTIDFNSGVQVNELSSFNLSWDVFIMKLNTHGSFMWARQLGGGDNDYAYYLTADPDGNIYSTGEFRNVADFDPGDEVFSLVSSGNSDIFISKLGNKDVTTGITEPGITYSNSVYPNPATNVVNLYSDSDNEGNYIVSDISGRIILSGRISGPQTQIDLTPYDSGIYFLKTDHDSARTLRILKQ